METAGEESEILLPFLTLVAATVNENDWRTLAQAFVVDMKSLNLQPAAGEIWLFRDSQWFRFNCLCTFPAILTLATSSRNSHYPLLYSIMSPDAHFGKEGMMAGRTEHSTLLRCADWRVVTIGDGVHVNPAISVMFCVGVCQGLYRRAATTAITPISISHMPIA